MSWKPEVQVAGENGAWHKNGLVFATEQEAADNARALMGKWSMVTACRAAPSQDAVNYKWVAGHLERVEEPVVEPESGFEPDNTDAYPGQQASKREGL